MKSKILIVAFRNLLSGLADLPVSLPWPRCNPTGLLSVLEYSKFVSSSGPLHLESLLHPLTSFSPFRLWVKGHLFRLVFPDHPARGFLLSLHHRTLFYLPHILSSASETVLLIVDLYSSWGRQTMALWGQKFRVIFCIPQHVRRHLENDTCASYLLKEWKKSNCY